MGIYDRDYYHTSRPSSGAGNLGIEGLTPVVKFLILANIAVFLLQIFVVREVRPSPLEFIREIHPELAKKLDQAEKDGPEALEAFKKKHPELDKILSEDELDYMWLPARKVSLFQDWFELDTKKVTRSGQIWRLLTHAFCHDRLSIWHIFLNMICLFWFGGTLESMYGSREFLLFYLTATVVAGLAFVGLDLYTGSTSPGIGASGAVMAVMMLYTMHFPRQIILVFWFFPIEIRWLMAIYVIWDLHPVLLALSGERMFTGIAHAAHLGGLAFGFLYAKYHWNLGSLVENISWPRWRWKSRPRLRLAPDTLPEPRAHEEADRLDEVLQKIFDHGQDSLNDEERDILRNASNRMRNKHGEEK